LKKLAKPVENNKKTTGKKTTGKKLGGCTGKGFKPGQSGNPGGRPKGLVSRALFEQLVRKVRIPGKAISVPG
jgi:hypothetical protein